MPDSSRFTQGGAKVRRICQSTIVGGACIELHHSDRILRTAWIEKEDFKIGIKKKKHWVDFYHYWMDVYTHFQHTFMFKQFEKLYFHPMTPLSLWCFWETQPWSESGKKSAQIKHCLQAKTIMCVNFVMRYNRRWTFFTGRSVKMNYGLIF